MAGQWDILEHGVFGGICPGGQVQGPLDGLATGLHPVSGPPPSVARGALGLPSRPGIRDSAGQVSRAALSGSQQITRRRKLLAQPTQRYFTPG